jgi:hypothetical protein
MRIKSASARFFSLALLLMSGLAWAQQPAPADPTKDPADPTSGHVMVQTTTVSNGGGAMVVQVGGSPGVGMMRLGGPPGMFGGDELTPVIMTLADLNIRPTFTLSDDQKQKIQAIRDDFKQNMEKWRTDHADELKALDDQQKEMFDNMQNGGGPDPQAMMENANQRQQLMETAPKGDEHAKQVKALLTPEQLKQLETRQAEQEKEREEMMKRMPMRMTMRGGGGAPPPDKDPADQDKDKDGKDKGR